MKYKVLIYQPKQLGDILLCTPLIRAMKQALSSIEIHFFTTKIGISILQNNPYIDFLHILNKDEPFLQKIRVYTALRKLRFDALFDMIGTPKSVLISAYINPKSSFVLQSRFGGLLSTKVVPDSENPYGYSLYSKILLFEAWLKHIKKHSLLKNNLLDYSQKLEIFLTEPEKQAVKEFLKKYNVDKDTIALNVVSRREYKIWKPSNFAKIVEFLLEKNKKILFLYGPGELDIVYKVSQLLPKKYEHDKRLLIEYDFLNIRRLYGVLQACKMYIGNDGGPKHLACAAEIPTITIFQNINPKNWTPVNQNKMHKVFESDSVALADILFELEKII